MFGCIHIMTQCISWFILLLVYVFVFDVHIICVKQNQEFCSFLLPKSEKEEEKICRKISFSSLPFALVVFGHLVSFEIPLLYCLFIVYYYYHLRYTELYRFFFILLFILLLFFVFILSLLFAHFPSSIYSSKF